MKVKAKTMVYFNNRRYKEGQIFELSNKKEFSERTMEKVKGASRGRAQAPVEEETEIEIETENVSDQEVI